MTKRSCPFDTGVIRQFKIHLNNIDCDKVTLKQMQDKTLKKLLSAQKNVSNWINNIVSNSNGSDIRIYDDSACCTYCDCKTQDIHKCNVCFEMYCQDCSFADYSKDNEERTCKTCS